MSEGNFSLATHTTTNCSNSEAVALDNLLPDTVAAVHLSYIALKCNFLEGALEANCC